MDEVRRDRRSDRSDQARRGVGVRADHLVDASKRWLRDWEDSERCEGEEQVSRSSSSILRSIVAFCWIPSTAQAAESACEVTRLPKSGHPFYELPSPQGTKSRATDLDIGGRKPTHLTRPFAPLRPRPCL